MNVFRIWTTRKNEKGTSVYIDLETEIGSIEELTDLLNRGKMVRGNQLWTRFMRDDEGKFMEIYRSRPVVIAAPGICTIETPELRYIRFVDESAPAAAEPA